MPHCFEAAIYWLSLGVHVLPCQPGRKELVRGFGPHLEHVVDRGQAEAWFALRYSNMAAVLGGAPGLGCIDFDDVGQFNRWRSGVGAGVQTRIERSPRGAHVFFFCAVADPLAKLVFAAAAGVEVKRAGAVLVAPSVHHPSGRAYAVVVKRDPIIVDDLAQLLPSPAYDIAASVPSPLSTTAIEHRANQPFAPDPELVARLKRVVSIVDLVREMTELKGGGRWLTGRCPVCHRADHLVIDTDRRLWKCHAATCPSNANGARAHDVINLVAWVEHVSNEEAIRRLAERIGAVRR